MRIKPIKSILEMHVRYLACVTNQSKSLSNTPYKWPIDRQSNGNDSKSISAEPKWLRQRHASVQATAIPTSNARTAISAGSGRHQQLVEDEPGDAADESQRLSNQSRIKACRHSVLELPRKEVQAEIKVT